MRRLLQRCVAQVGEGLVAREGKCVVELKPVGVDKGSAVAEYLAESPFAGRFRLADVTAVCAWLSGVL